MRPIILRVLEELLARHRAEGRVDLNDIAEVIGDRAVTYEEVEYLVDALEAQGLEVGEPVTANEVVVMRAILEQARSLRATLGRTPTLVELAEASGHPTHVVRRALERGISARPSRSPT